MKRQKMQKIVMGILAIVMVISLMLPVFANIFLS